VIAIWIRSAISTRGPLPHTRVSPTELSVDTPLLIQTAITGDGQAGSTAAYARPVATRSGRA
jgi:hypothetical protein